MSDWETFFAMGGYAAFVWPAYVISLVALAALFAQSWRAMKHAERLVDRSANASRVAEATVKKPQAPPQEAPR